MLCLENKSYECIVKLINRLMLFFTSNIGLRLTICSSPTYINNLKLNKRRRVNNQYKIVTCWTSAIKAIRVICIASTTIPTRVNCTCCIFWERKTRIKLIGWFIKPNWLKNKKEYTCGPYVCLAIITSVARRTCAIIAICAISIAAASIQTRFIPTCWVLMINTILR